MSSRVEGDDGPGTHAVLLGAECRPLRRALRPLVWVTLEEVALDAVVEDGGLVARTSARLVAERLGIDPSTAAKALQALRQRGLVSLEREKGPAGRFGLSVYALAPVTGLTVVSPCAAAPHVTEPAVAESHMVSPYPGEPHADTSTPASHPDRAGRDLPEPAAATAGIRADGGARAARRPSGVGSRPTPPSACPGQEALDLGWGSSS